VRKKARLEDVARNARVSTATVSRVLSEYPGVKEETRIAVKRALEELGYFQKKAGLKKHSRLIGLMVDNVRNPFFGDMVFHLQNGMLEHGYVITPLSIEFDSVRETELLKAAGQHDLAALILLSSMDSKNLEQALHSIQCPVTLTDRVIEGFQGNIVIQDNFQAGYIAAKHLIDLGYHEITFIAGNRSSASSMRRVEGYQQALRNAFLPVDESWIICGEMSIRRGYEAGLEYIENLEHRPRAVLLANDMTAIGFMDACREKGVRIPEDLSIVSFDGIDISALKCFNLTTVRQPVEEMCKRICEITIQAIEEPEHVKDQRIMLEPALIVRGSTCVNTRPQR
jgi:DNA-binding LacI/PurR family transcriptional regulator